METHAGGPVACETNMTDVARDAVAFWRGMRTRGFLDLPITRHHVLFKLAHDGHLATILVFAVVSALIPILHIGEHYAL